MKNLMKIFKMVKTSKKKKTVYEVADTIYNARRPWHDGHCPEHTFSQALTCLLLRHATSHDPVHEPIMSQKHLITQTPLNT